MISFRRFTLPYKILTTYKLCVCVKVAGENVYYYLGENRLD